MKFGCRVHSSRTNYLDVEGWGMQMHETDEYETDKIM